MCVEDFEKDQHDEVDLKVGDPVIVLNREDPDWWIGENETQELVELFQRLL